MKLWIVIQTTSDAVRVIYVGTSKNKALKVAEQNEDVDNGAYCYVDYWNGTRIKEELE